MGKHEKTVLASWTHGSADRQYTLSVCRECATFMLEAFHTGDQSHGDVRYFDSGMERMDPQDVRCAELAPGASQPGIPQGERTQRTQEESAGRPNQDRGPTTPNLDARMKRADTIRDIAAFMEHLGGSGYFLAGTPHHTHIENIEDIEGTQGSGECWGKPGCPWEDDPDHTPPTGERGDHIVRRSAPIRKLADSFLGIDSQAASMEMEVLFEHTRRRNTGTENAGTEN